MCFTKEITAGMMLLNLGTGLLLTKRGHHISRTQIFYTFFAMEVLQFIQHFVAGDCDNWINQLTTVLSFIHICFQPLSVNIFLFRHEPNRDVARTVHRLCILGGCLALLRLPYLGIAYIPDWVRTYVPEIPDVKLAGQPEVCAWEIICGPKTCAVQGNLHIGWTLPQLPPSYFIPSGAMHFISFFGPALIAPGIWHPERIAFVVLGLLSGPLLTQAWATAASGPVAGRLEWPSVWCLYAVVQILLGIGLEFFLGVDEAVNQPGHSGYERFRTRVLAGKLWGGTPDVLAAAGPRWSAAAAAGKGVGGRANGKANGGGAAAVYDDDTAGERDANGREKHA